ncbi:MAG TPA: signal recognition particle-docking protein FtsY [Ignavibacteriaceae bacterium]|nr:signal recognition particle-docking protein FtsY [Ignavibacteriaceae bacterium]
MGLFDNFNFNKLKEGLAKTRNKIVNTLNEVVTGVAIIDDRTIDEIEDVLISSDIGYDTAIKITDSVRFKIEEEKNPAKLNLVDIVKKELVNVLHEVDAKDQDDEIKNHKPYVILIVGINGVGKTTTIGKLAHNFKSKGLKVIVGAADTFRAAANEQLEIWAQRAGVEILRKQQGADPSSVAFETVQKAISNKYDIVLIDTAGRLHNKAHLMDELNKIKRVLGKNLSYAPNETLLVLDGNTGQNAIIQAEEFSKVTDITGLIITKLDGTAKGGVVFQIVDKQRVPIKYIGIGEGIEDLQTFNAEQFVSAIFE